MARVLVTGASGFIGGHIARRLARSGWDVRTIVRSASTVAELERDGIECQVGNLLTVHATDRAVAECQAIVHCAAKVGDAGPVTEFLHENVGALKNLLAAATRVPDLRRFVMMSSLGVYEPRDHFGTTEDEPLAENPLDGYTLSKIESERVLSDWLRSSPHVTGIVLRPGFVYGPGDRTVTPRLMEALTANKFAFFGRGEKRMNVIFIDHLVEATVRALQARIPQPKSDFRKTVTGSGGVRAYNLTDGRPPSRLEFVAAFCRELGIPTPTRHVPEGVARILCEMCEGVYQFLGVRSPPLLSRAKYKFLALNLEFSIERAITELGYDPRIALNEAVKRTVDERLGRQPQESTLRRADFVAKAAS